MRLRLLSGLLAATIIWLSPAQAQERQITTTQNSDYFGFDLRAERDVSLDECKAICISLQCEGALVLPEIRLPRNEDLQRRRGR